MALLKEQTEKIVATGDQHHPALFIFERANPPELQRVAIVPVPLDKDDPGSKTRAFQLIHHMAESEIVEGVIFVVESWIKTLPTDVPEPDRTKSLEDDPERQEAIVFNAQQGAMQLIAYCKINRLDNTLEEPFIIDPLGDKEHATGRMIYNKPEKH